MYKQIIVVNKGLNMSKGKMSAQVSHASIAFLASSFRISHTPVGSNIQINVEKDIHDEWFEKSFTKVILEVKNEIELIKVVEKSKACGLVEEKDFFCIRDNCHTELIPDETGTRWTCIGFKPMEASKIDMITKRLQLFKD